MAYRAEAPDVVPEAESFAAEILADDGLQEVNPVARRLLGDKDLRIHLFVMDVGIIRTIRG